MHSAGMGALSAMNENRELFESMPVPKALASLAIPTIISSVKNRKMAKVTYRMQSQRAVNSTPEF